LETTAQEKPAAGREVSARANTRGSEMPKGLRGGGITRSCVALALVFIAGSVSSTQAFAQQPNWPSRMTPVPVTALDRWPQSGDAKLTLRVYDYARVDASSLARSERLTSAIFERIGIKVAWTDCPLSQAAFRAYPACQSNGGPADLVLRILPRSMALKLSAPGEPLGFALPCPDSEPGCELTAFAFRIEQAAAQGYPADSVLAYVIAHEVAHVLIGPGHSLHGIMRGEWSRHELALMCRGGHPRFTDDQARNLRAAVLRRNANQSVLTTANLLADGKN
jgi:hypothetical protein